VTTAQRFLRFIAVGAMGIGVQLATLWGLTEVVGLHYLPATGIAVTAAVVHNFVWHRRWTWRDRSRARWARTFVAFALANGVVSLGGNLVVMGGLVGFASVSPVPANVAAIGLCGLLNYWLGDRVVFLRRANFKPDHTSVIAQTL
jgi:putative flippase GtrA